MPSSSPIGPGFFIFFQQPALTAKVPQLNHGRYDIFEEELKKKKDRDIAIALSLLLERRF